MAKSNWKGSSGWTAIDDPTGVLEGRVLVASAGSSQTTEDYLTEIAGTSSAFNISHYCVKMEYAYTRSSYQFEAGSLGLIALATNYSGGTPSTAQDCYIALFNNETQTVDIRRRKNSVEYTLAQATIPSNVSTTSIKHTMEFKCYGTSPRTLILNIDGKTAINIGDNTSDALTAGDPGIHVRGGTSYVDNFTVLQYSSDGSEPAEWTPSNYSTSADVALWLKSDTGVTVTGTAVSAWADQSSYSNNASQSSGANQPVQVISSINGINSIQFDGSSKFMDIADSASLDLNSTGISFFIFCKPTPSTLPPSSAYCFILKDGTYGIRMNMDGDSNSNPSFDNFSAVETGTTNAISGNNWQIIEGSKGDAFYVNASNAGAYANSPGADNSNGLKLGNAGSGGQYFSGEIAEIILLKGAVSSGERQKIEGYLAHKYGVQSLLPRTHPYRYNSPTV
jgi:hypothetical protein